MLITFSSGYGKPERGGPIMVIDEIIRKWKYPARADKGEFV
jgi:hypothetical protein